MAGVIAWGSLWALNFVHVMSGVLWTGIDLFMGFVVGPVMRTLPPPARRAMVLRLMPRMLFLLPTLSILTGTTGWFHASAIGFLDVGWPEYGCGAGGAGDRGGADGAGPRRAAADQPAWCISSCASRCRTAHGSAGWMRRYVVAVALQGVMQVGMIVVMARFVTGL